METSVLSKGIKLEYKQGNGLTFTEVLNVQSIPDLGGSVDSVEITTLSDEAHAYRNGIKSYGDNLEFKVLYDKAEFARMRQLNGSTNWKVSLPDGEDGAIDTICEFSGEPSVKLDSVGVNAPLTYTLSIKINSDMSFS